MDPFIGQLAFFPFSWAPRGWMLCNGQTLNITQNQALFAVIGFRYGGNGSSTFMLPDLQGKVPLHVSPTHTLGSQTGEATHTLITSEIPSHTHTILASTAVPSTTGIDPTGKTWATLNNTYAPVANIVNMASNALSTVGGNAHENMQPYNTVSICIAVQGIFPTRP